MKLTKTHLKQIIKEELQGVLKEQGPAVPLLKTYSAAKAWAQGTKATKLAGETALSTSSAATNAAEEDYIGMSLDTASIVPGPQQPFVIAAATTYAVGKWFNKLNKKQQDTFHKLNSRFNGKKSRNAALQSWRRANGLRPDGTCCLNRKKFPPVKSAAEARGHWQPSITDMSIDSKEQKALANWFSQDFAWNKSEKE